MTFPVRANEKMKWEILLLNNRPLKNRINIWFNKLLIIICRFFLHKSMQNGKGDKEEKASIDTTVQENIYIL